MAYCSTEKSYGYEDSRFETKVDENFHCSICYNVLKEPRTCANNDHIFCLACITEHLMVNSHTCPECNEHLRADTLRRPRVLNNYLSKLRISCDYANRGCPEFTSVEDLDNHVAKCGFAPVFCSNEQCGKEINRREKVHHESEVCDYRKVKCHDCGALKASLVALDGKVGETNKEIKNINVEVKKVVGKVERRLFQMDEKMEAVQMEVKNCQQEIKKEVKDMKEHLWKVDKDVDDIRIMMSQMLEKLTMLELFKKQPSVTGGMLKTRREDILIAGGDGTSTTEIYSWKKNGWFKVALMNEDHLGASSFIYKDQLFVAGGENSRNIEYLDLNELSLKWIKFPDELPVARDDHQTVVYQQCIIHIGGYSYDMLKVSNAISELQLAVPCTLKLLCQMPQPRQCHGAEIFEEKVLILGGESMNEGSPMESVLEFDVKKNECSKKPPLPNALSKMATVRWRDKVILIGGENGEGNILNDVFMYDWETGEITVLPSMLERRKECCAVITKNTIVVMGGNNSNDDCHSYLNSVECFTMGHSTWERLPAMNQARYRAIAEVLSSTRKYV